MTAALAVDETADHPAARYPAMLTWSAPDAPRLETVRVQVGPRGLRAAGRIVGGECAQHRAFSASYDLLLGGDGVTRRLGMRSLVAGGERHLSMTRDAEGFWLVDHGHGPRRADFGGALDVDVVLSPFFNALTVRRLGLHQRSADVQVAVVYVAMPELSVSAQAHHYTSDAERITVRTPLGTVGLTVDAEGFVVDYPGLSTRA